MGDFGEEIKRVELEEAGRRMVLPIPVIARLDGRAFHTYTRGLKRPYDETFIWVMQETTKALVEEFHADVGYTQSDEITLVWRKPNVFDGRFQKLTSILAGYASATFVRLADNLFPGKKNMTPCFDCRVFQVESEERAVDILAWREYDATKNSVAMAAQSMFSHKELQNKHRAQMMDMMHEKGVNWNNYPDHFKKGSYFKRVSRMRHLTPEELEKIPEKYRPTGPVVRTKVEELDLNPINTYERHDAAILLFAKMGYEEAYEKLP